MSPLLKRSKVATDIILKEWSISCADKYCGQLFGMPNFLPNMSLSQVITAWFVKTVLQQQLFDQLCLQVKNTSVLLKVGRSDS
jgi:hypothetical protein